MKTLVLLALLVASCGAQPETETVYWDFWLDHGQPDACSGVLEMQTPTQGKWTCGADAGPVAGRLEPDVFLQLGFYISVNGHVRDYDGAIIGTDGRNRPFVGYRR